MTQLTQKETALLKDLKGQEKICVEKYAQYAEKAHDPQLKDLFSRLSEAEQKHYDAVL